MINNEKEAAEKLKVVLKSRKDKRGKTETDEALEIAIKALESKWISVSNPNKELPKDRILWVTIYMDNIGLAVTTLYWDMTEWSEDIVDHVLAYMDYVVPEPYKMESDE